MTRVLITEGFSKDLGQVESNRVYRNVLDVMAKLETIPTMGSRDIPQSIQERYGDNVRKIPVNPFDLITRYDEAADELVVVGLIHQRSAW